MKRILSASLALLIFAVVMPYVFVLPGAKAEPAATPAPDASSPPRTNFEAGSDSEEFLRVLIGDEPVEMTMGDYIRGVVAAEMPADFGAEALKAQAVAARTYAMYGMENGGGHENADVCADSGCCQAYRSDEELRAVWGDNFDKNLAAVKAAVTETDGEYLCYAGEPILAAFHSSSGGDTESSAAVWGSDRAYLRSVTSPETAEDVPNYNSTVTFSRLDLRDTILYAHPEADFTGEPASWIGETTLDDGGRVDEIKIGGVLMTGEEIRSLFSLRSTQFTLSYNGEFVFDVVGYGHGVGMSQYGAKVMAQNGTGYREILAHYYPGTELLSSR